jgi:hypothetical protein
MNANKEITMTTTSKPETTNVRCWGQSRPAMLDRSGAVLVLDPVSGTYTRCHPLTPAQERYVRARVRAS